jgi:hydroquinone glucosyltransferase
MTAGAEMRDVLPEGFETRTKDRGLVVDSWAPQIGVLSHPSTGGFLSHCGWNSTIESILHGVPMVAWPLFAEQRMNAFFLVKEMKVAIEAQKGADGLVRREEVERAAREVMEGDGGMEMKKRMAELMRQARFAMVEGGSSYNALANAASVWKEMHATKTPPAT